MGTVRPVAIWLEWNITFMQKATFMQFFLVSFLFCILFVTVVDCSSTLDDIDWLIILYWKPNRFIKDFPMLEWTTCSLGLLKQLRDLKDQGASKRMEELFFFLLFYQGNPNRPKLFLQGGPRKLKQARWKEVPLLRTVSYSYMERKRVPECSSGHWQYSGVAHSRQ